MSQVQYILNRNSDSPELQEKNKQNKKFFNRPKFNLEVGNSAKTKYYENNARGHATASCWQDGTQKDTCTRNPGTVINPCLSSSTEAPYCKLYKKLSFHYQTGNTKTNNFLLHFRPAILYHSPHHLLTELFYTKYCTF